MVLGAEFRRGGYAERLLAWFCKICVALYAFISGYGLFFGGKKIKAEAGEGPTLPALYRSTFSRAVSFLKKYWLVFLLFIPIGYCLGKLSPVSPKVFLLSFLGIQTAFNGEWWYVPQYLYLLLLFPYVDRAFDFLSEKKKRNLGNFCLLALMTVFYAGLLFLWFGRSLSAIVCCLSFTAGYISARYSLFEKIHRGIDVLAVKCAGREASEKRAERARRTVELFCGAATLFICVSLRMYLSPGAGWLTYDFLFSPVFCLAVFLLTKKEGPVTEFLSRVGKYSTYMWLTHGFFCYYYFQELITASKISTVMFLTLIAVSLFTAFLLQQIEKGLQFLEKKARAGLKSHRARRDAAPE